MPSRRGGRRRDWALAWAATGGALFLLFWPFSSQGRGVEGWDKSVHVLLFAVLGWAWTRCFVAGWRARWGVALALAAGTVAVELVQPLTGRSCDWLDAAAGSLGAGWVAFCGAGGRWRSVAAGAGALALAGLWSLGGWLDWRAEKAAWPVLADGEAAWGLASWKRNGTEVSAGEGGIRVAAVEGVDRRWPGIFRQPLETDWRGRGTWRVAVYWPEEEPVAAGVRLDDERKKRPKYGERFQREVTLTNGENLIEIPAEEWGRTGNGGELDAEHIARWGVFLVKPKTFSYFLLRKAELE